MDTKERHSNERELGDEAKLHYLADQATADEKQAVEAWLQADPAHERELSDVAAIYYAWRTRERIAARDVSKAYRRVRGRIGQGRRQLWLRHWAVAAACFVGGLLLSSLFFLNNGGEERTGMVTVRSNAGVRTQFSLPDGTLVDLNAGSTLSYPASWEEKKERRVALTGEAYFKVERDEAHPFVVSVKEERLQVKVLGTEFNVQAYEGDRTVGTTLVNGSVALEARTAPHTLKRMKLRPSEKAVWDVEAGTVSVRTVDTANETAWREGRLVFKEEPLPEVLRRLSHYYNVRFEVADPILNSYRFTGTFDNKQLFQVLDYLSLSSRITYRIAHREKDDSLQVHQTIVRLINQ